MVDRYKIRAGGYGALERTVDPDGEWVRFGDYQALREALQKLMDTGLTFDQLEIAQAALEGNSGV